MILSDTTIKKYISEGKISIGPIFNESCIKMSGIRLHLDDEVLVPKGTQVVEDLNNIGKLKYKKINIKEKGFYLEPNGFILAATFEEISTPRDILFMLDGRSTIARIGLTTHVTASVIDGTLDGAHSPILEIKNLGNFRIKLNYRDPIALGYFVKLTEPVNGGQLSNYRGSDNKVAPPNSDYK